ncbi:MAG TPA: DNA translocase FtsK [Thermoanaerobaculia bacterium]|nr:DNA translocase FtsK [Thermoanaerobaculia bacterium]
MALAVTKTQKRPEKPTLSPEKTSELLGFFLLALALLIGCALGTYHPLDPSLFHKAASEARPRNLIGPAGAEAAAFAFQFLGISCLLVPLFLLVAAFRRLRRRAGARVVGRGFGMVLILAALPGLFQLTTGRLPWREGSIDAGGAFGKILADLLEPRLHFTGSLLVLSAAVAIGGTLAVQSTLGDLLAAWKFRIQQIWQDLSFARDRRRERRAKERARRRVITKHLQRVVEEKQEKQKAAAARLERSAAVVKPPSARPVEAPTARSSEVPTRSVEEADPFSHRLDLPLRSRAGERLGEDDFAVRRLRPVDPNPMDFEEDDEAAFDDLELPVARVPPAVVRAPIAARVAERAVERPGMRVPGPQPGLPFAGEISTGSLPPINLLQMAEERTALDEAELVRMGEMIRNRCGEFGVEGTIEGASPGPVITVYEFQPAPGVKVSQIVNLQDDLALALRAESVRIDRMAGRSTLGIEVPNRERRIIRLGNLLADERFRKAPSPLTLAIGTNIHGEPYYCDLATMPHLLVAGATGAGKSVGLQGMITSILYKATREEVQFIFIDPKRIELGVYADIPHLKAEVVVDPKKAANALRWAVAEMERRYRLLAEVHVRSIAYYNRAIQDPQVQERLSLSDEAEVTPSDLKPMPYYVVVIDELADLMMVASADVETSIARLAQMARAVGIHLIVATQRPSVDVLTGTIKANFPCRISFATASRHDSRTILDQVGSEKLLGKGDMLMMPPGSSRVIRLHGAYVSEQETAALIRWLKKQGKPQLDPDVLRDESPEGASSTGDEGDDDLYEEAARLVVTERQASASFLQRRMRIGFSRAGRLIDMMERDGLLGPSQGSKAREVLVRPDYFEEIDAARGGEDE